MSTYLSPVVSSGSSTPNTADERVQQQQTINPFQALQQEFGAQVAAMTAAATAVARANRARLDISSDELESNSSESKSVCNKLQQTRPKKMSITTTSIGFQLDSDDNNPISEEEDSNNDARLGNNNLRLSNQPHSNYEYDRDQDDDDDEELGTEQRKMLRLSGFPTTTTTAVAAAKSEIKAKSKYHQTNYLSVASRTRRVRQKQQKRKLSSSSSGSSSSSSALFCMRDMNGGSISSGTTNHSSKSLAEKYLNTSSSCKDLNMEYNNNNSNTSKSHLHGIFASLKNSSRVNLSGFKLKNEFKNILQSMPAVPTLIATTSIMTLAAILCIFLLSDSHLATALRNTSNIRNSHNSSNEQQSYADSDNAGQQALLAAAPEQYLEISGNRGNKTKNSDSDQQRQQQQSLTTQASNQEGGQGASQMQSLTMNGDSNRNTDNSSNNNNNEERQRDPMIDALLIAGQVSRRQHLAQGQHGQLDQNLNKGTDGSKFPSNEDGLQQPATPPSLGRGHRGALRRELINDMIIAQRKQHERQVSRNQRHHRQRHDSNQEQHGHSPDELAQVLSTPSANKRTNHHQQLDSFDSETTATALVAPTSDEDEGQSNLLDSISVMLFGDTSKQRHQQPRPEQKSASSDSGGDSKMVSLPTPSSASDLEQQQAPAALSLADSVYLDGEPPLAMVRVGADTGSGNSAESSLATVAPTEKPHSQPSHLRLSPLELTLAPATDREHRVHSSPPAASSPRPRPHSHSHSTGNKHGHQRHSNQQLVNSAATSPSVSTLPPSASSTSASSSSKQHVSNHERAFDVVQIQCNNTEEGFERFACPTPDFYGRYRCIEDRLFCDGYYDCPGGEDEGRISCMYYRVTDGCCN